MDYTLIALIGNISVNVILALLYSYRIKIEKRQVQIIADNAESKRCLESIKRAIAREKDDLTRMSPEELKEFLDFLEKMGE
jgi:hypothetical protein